jgi:hypothetical protein
VEDLLHGLEFVILGGMGMVDWIQSLVPTQSFGCTCGSAGVVVATAVLLFLLF